MTNFDLDQAVQLLGARAALRVLDLGCGDGVLVRALAERGFRCTAIDRDPPPVAMPGVTFVRSDLRTYDPGVATFDLVIARNVLQFFLRQERRSLFRRALRAVAPDGFLFVEAFTAYDPSREAVTRRGFAEVEPGTFVDPCAGDVIGFFEAQELRSWAEAEALSILRYEERMVEDDDDGQGAHRHGIAFLAASTRLRADVE